jgi:3-methyl-2-oxobutanoate hydroxymethyltransferase
VALDRASAPKLTARSVSAKKRKGDRIVCLTAYDYPTALLLDEAGVDLMLVGDSVANVFYGRSNTLAVGVEEMVFHTRAVSAGVQRALVVADMPFLSYQVSVERAVENAGRLLKAGAEAVKLEGAGPIVATARRLVELGMPVMGHLGLVPQSVHKLGGYHLQACRPEEQQQLLADAQALEQAGCFALVLEKIPAELAGAVSKVLSIPTIGIGAGPGCDGQILVLHDMLGIPSESRLRFVRTYARVGEAIRDAVTRYCADVRSGAFPATEHSFHAGEGR